MSKKILMSISLFALLLLASCGKIVENITDSDSEGDGQNEQAESVDAQGDSEENSEESAELGDYHIQFGGEVIENQDQFIVEGTSNLLPGSRIVGEVIVDEGETVFSDTSELVDDDGSFYMELEHHQYGDAEIIFRFDFEGVQEDEIKRHYGEKGQKLEGPFIYKHETFDGILKKAEARIDYASGGENDLAIKAPDWYDLPEDYGDPRVWIEIEDIAEDGEHFYVHGRSNILEGSELRVKYRNNQGKTQVNPDGSFDFKFDYEYLEDQDIVITFEPSAFQWNEIEEAYGATGQKLVGNLVVSDKFNSEKQYIEKRIPWDDKSAESSNRNNEQEPIDDEEEEREDDQKELENDEEEPEDDDEGKE